MYEIYEKLLKENGLTSYKVAKACKISQSSLSDWKNGKSKPKHDKMIRIAEYLNVDVDYLETGVKPQKVKISGIEFDDGTEKGIKKESAITDGLSELDLETIELIKRMSDEDRKRLANFAKALLASEPQD